MKVLELIDNALKIIEDVERTHKNLGIYVLWCKLVDIANLGTILVAPRGTGKTRAVEALKKLPHRDIAVVSNLTPAGLMKLVDLVNENSITILNKDISGFYSEYIRDVGLNLVASLITDHEYVSATGRHYIEVHDAYISFISCCTPSMLHKLSKLDSWEAMYKDRFIRLFVLYFRDYKPYPGEIDVRHIEFPELDVNAVVLPDSVKETKIFKEFKNVLMEQTSPGRGKLYAEMILKASAWLNGRDTVVDEDLELIKHYTFLIALERMCSERLYGPGEPLVFDYNAFALLFFIYSEKEVSRRKIKEHFKISWKAVEPSLKKLMKWKLVQGVWGGNKYKPSRMVRELWLNNILKFYREYGVMK